MATYKFILKRKKKDGKLPDAGRIYLQYGHDSLTSLIAAKKSIDKKYWDQDKGRVKGKYENKTALNAFLTSFEERVQKFVTNLETEGKSISAADIKTAWDLAEKARVPEATILLSMNNQWKAYIKYLGETTSKKTSQKRAGRTIQTNENSREAFEEFLTTNKIEAIRPEAFTITHFHRWEAFLQNKYASGNTISKRLKHFKAALKHSKKIGYPVGFDLDLIEYSEKAGHKICINDQELEIIQAKELVGRKDLIRDFIVIACNVGLRISDFKRLDKNIQGGDIVIQTQKTGEPVEIPIAPIVFVLLKKYNNVLPSIPEPVFRREVKALFKEIFPDKFLQLKVNGEMTSVHKGDYITLHSFIRTLVNKLHNKGVPVGHIAKLTGKSISVLLKHYLSASQEDASRSMRETFTAPMAIDKTA